MEHRAGLEDEVVLDEVGMELEGRDGHAQRCTARVYMSLVVVMEGSGR